MRRWCPTFLPLLVACTDYGYLGKEPEPNAGSDTGPGAFTDTAGPIVDSAGTGGEPGPAGTPDTQDTAGRPDTGHPDTGHPTTDTAPTDICYEPEDGYTTNAASRIFTTDSTTSITVTFVESSTSYSDELDIDSPESKKLIYAYSDSPGKILRLGPYATGTELIFGIDVNDTGMHWQSGPAGRNSDGVEHVAATYEGGCSWLIGFEDLTGGGDLDFNDVVMRVEGMLKQEN